MTELPPEAAALLAEAQHRHGPSESDRARVRSRLHASLGIGATVAVAASTAAAASATAAEGAAMAPAGIGAKSALLGWKGALFSWKATKVMLATFAVSGAVGVGSMVVQTSKPNTTAPASATQRDEHAARRPADSLPYEAIAAPDPRGSAVAASNALLGNAANTADGAPRASARGAKGADETMLLAAASGREQTKHKAIRASSRAHRKSSRASSERSSSLRERSAALVESRAVDVSHEATPLRASEASPAAVEAVARVEGEPSAQPTRAEDPRAQPKADDQRAAEKQPHAREAGGKESQGELALLRAALASLRDHDASHALDVLSEHAARYPRGAFATERRGLRVLALCADGQFLEAKRERSTFLEEAPGSPIAARVRAACARD